MNIEVNQLLLNIYNKYNLKFIVKIVDGSGASSHPAELWLGKETIETLNKEQIEALIVHEAFHQIFKELDETEEFKEKDKGNITPYLKKEIMTWNKVKEEFPEYSEIINNNFICTTYGITQEEKEKLEREVSK